MTSLLLVGTQFSSQKFIFCFLGIPWNLCSSDIAEMGLLEEYEQQYSILTAEITSYIGKLSLAAIGKSLEYVSSFGLFIIVCDLNFKTTDGILSWK